MRKAVLRVVIGIFALASVPTVMALSPEHPPSTAAAPIVRAGPPATISNAALLRKLGETTTTSTTAPPTTTTTTRRTVTTRASRSRPVTVAPSSPNRQVVLDCIALHEGNPAYTNGIGTAKKYRGRYQFDQDSWNKVAAKYGRPDLVGVDVAAASPADQDDMAWRYYEHSKYGPWPPSQGNCP